VGDGTANEAAQTRVWSALTFVVVSLALTSLLATSEATVGFRCENDDECGCTPPQQMQDCSRASGAAGFCAGGACQCNPGFSGENCDQVAVQPTQAPATSNMGLLIGAVLLFAGGVVALLRRRRE
jgi:hypothetical protein